MRSGYAQRRECMDSRKAEKQAEYNLPSQHFILSDRPARNTSSYWIKFFLFVSQGPGSKGRPIFQRPNRVEKGIEKLSVPHLNRIPEFFRRKAIPPTHTNDWFDENARASHFFCACLLAPVRRCLCWSVCFPRTIMFKSKCAC